MVNYTANNNVTSLVSLAGGFCPYLMARHTLMLVGCGKLSLHTEKNLQYNRMKCEERDEFVDVN